MVVKEAVAAAKQYVLDLFADEQIADLGLEEVQKDGDVWQITLGFARPWDKARDALSAIAFANQPHRGFRSFKIVRISDENAGVISITERRN